MAMCQRDESGKCREHGDVFEAGHMDWGDEPVCDWAAWMFAHGECLVCPAPKVSAPRKRRRRESSDA